MEGLLQPGVGVRATCLLHAVTEYGGDRLMRPGNVRRERVVLRELGGIEDHHIDVRRVLPNHLQRDSDAVP